MSVKKATVKAASVKSESSERIVTFQGVEQIFHVDTKVVKALGLKLERYIKLDGTVSSLYVLKGKESKSTKALHDLLTTGRLSEICKYWGYVHGYKVSEKHVEEFSKLTGIKVA